jgi:CheY-like chemotaxis protein
LTLRVLVVDDEQVLCELVARMLREAGYEVVTACDGETGLDLIATAAESFDLVVTDSRLPGISGRELVARLRAGRPTLPIVHLTGSLRCGGVGFPSDVRTLIKPFDLPQLIPTVRELLPA